MNFVDHRRKSISHTAAISLLAVLLAVALAAISAAPSARAQQQNDSSAAAAPDLRAYVGTWKASFQGKVFAILVLREKRGSLEGTLNNFEISFDKQGNLRDGTHIDRGVSPLITPRFRNGSLIFTVAKKDAYAQTTDWSFVVKNGREGELTENLDNQYEAPTNMVVKPIRMFREFTKH